jgi:hypothetical protein
MKNRVAENINSYGERYNEINNGCIVVEHEVFRTKIYWGHNTRVYILWGC